MSKAAERLVRMLAVIAFAGWVYLMVDTYMLGEHGLSFRLYAHNVLKLGLAALSGFLLVWAAVWLTARHATPPASLLAKQVGDFTPLLISPPLGHDVSPLESELIGLVQGYQHWPATPADAAPNLSSQAMRRWHLVKGLPHAGTLHRAAALASPLGCLLGTRESRTSPSLWNLNQADAVTLTPHLAPTGAMAAAVLSTLPAFTQMPLEQQDTLLLALRHMDNPADLPVEGSMAARDIIAKIAWAKQHVG